MGSVIIGSGRALPARIVTNDELSEIVDTTDEWIVPRTGIHTRHVAIEETCTDLGAQAALRALGLEEGGWQREAGAIEAASLDMIICPTLTADTTSLRGRPHPRAHRCHKRRVLRHVLRLLRLRLRAFHR